MGLISQMSLKLSSFLFFFCSQELISTTLYTLIYSSVSFNLLLTLMYFSFQLFCSTLVFKTFSKSIEVLTAFLIC